MMVVLGAVLVAARVEKGLQMLVGVVAAMVAVASHVEDAVVEALWRDKVGAVMPQVTG